MRGLMKSRILPMASSAAVPTLENGVMRWGGVLSALLGILVAGLMFGGVAPASAGVGHSGNVAGAANPSWPAPCPAPGLSWAWTADKTVGVCARPHYALSAGAVYPGLSVIVKGSTLKVKVTFESQARRNRAMLKGKGKIVVKAPGMKKVTARVNAKGQVKVSLPNGVKADATVAVTLKRCGTIQKVTTSGTLVPPAS
jgi:hypothetical protein